MCGNLLNIIFRNSLGTLVLKFAFHRHVEGEVCFGIVSEFGRQSLIADAYGGPGRLCPMRGKRLPELIAGELESVLLRLTKLGHERLLAKVRVRVSASQWDEITAAFDSARARVQSALHVKFDFLRRLPWSLGALAHCDPAVGRRHALRIIQEFDDTPENVQVHHHTKTLLFLDPQGPLRASLENFAAGGSLEAHPALQLHVASFRYVNIVERFIEGRHAIIKRSSGRSGSAVSLSMRLPELEDMLQRQPEFLHALLGAFEEARHIACLPSLLGVASHPIFQSCSPYQMHHGAVIKHLRKILYRADVIGQFPEVRAAAAHHVRELGRRKSRAAIAVHSALGDPPAPAQTADSVRRGLFLEHFRTVAAEVPHALFSLPVEAAGCAGEMVAAALQPAFAARSAQAGGARAQAIAADVDMEDLEDLQAGSGAGIAALEDHEAPVAPAGMVGPVPDEREGAATPRGDLCPLPDVLFFKVAKASPKDWRVVTVSAAAGARVQTNDIIITAHQCFLHRDSDSPLVSSGPETTGNAVRMLRDLAGTPLRWLESHMKVWDAKAQSSYIIPSAASHIDPALLLLTFQRLCKAGAFGQADTDTPLQVGPQDACVPALQALQQQGYAERLEHRGGGGLEFWVLSRLGLANMQACRELGNPTLVAHSRTADLPLEQQSRYQLTDRLALDGWHWGKLPRGARRRQAIEYCKGSPKVWYSGEGLVSKAYLLCLLAADDLLAREGVDAIPHGRAVKFYEQLLLGKTREEAHAAACCRSAIVLDVAEEPAALEGDATVGGASVILPVAVFEENADCDVDEHPAQEEVNHEGDDDQEGVDESEGPPSPEPGLFPAALPGQQAQPPVGASQSDPVLADGAAQPCPRAFRMFRWGPFRFTPKFDTENRPTAWEAVCPYHRKSANTECKKSQAFHDEHSSQRVLNQLKQWSLQARDHDRQWKHMSVDPKTFDVLPDAVLEVRAIPWAERPEQRPLTDRELDAAEAAGAAAQGQGRGRGGRAAARGGGGGRDGRARGGQALARSRGRGRGRSGLPAQGADGDAAGAAASTSSPASSSSTSSSRSSSSSSSSSEPSGCDSDNDLLISLLEKESASRGERGGRGWGVDATLPSHGASNTFCQQGIGELTHAYFEKMCDKL
jgi:hypothetical protein